MPWQADGEPWAKRLAWIIDQYGDGDHKKLARRIRVDKETVRMWTKRSRPSMDNLAAILREYPAVNPEWLMAGTGPRERPALGEEERAVPADLIRELGTLYDSLALRYGEPTEPPEGPALRRLDEGETIRSDATTPDGK